MSVSRYALSVWRRNAAMYRRTWKLNILPNFFEPILYLVSIGIGVGAYVSQMGGTSYVAFLAPGLVAVAAMNASSAIVGRLPSYSNRNIGLLSSVARRPGRCSRDRW